MSRKVKCECVCHTPMPGEQIVHIQACCDNGWITIYDPVPLTDELKDVLRKMWELDEKARVDPSWMFTKSITKEEWNFIRKHRSTIIEYYKQQYEYWLHNNIL